MPYDPFARARHASPQRRRSIRLRGYDYTQAGAYFVTIVTRHRECLLGDVVDGEMRVNEFGRVVAECWDVLPMHFPNVELDAFVVMPNHVHGIVVIRDGIVGAQHAAPLQASPLPADPPHPNVEPGSLGAIIRSFKSAVTKRINASRDTAGASVWQRNYYEHIIRNEKSLNAIRTYITNNPANWSHDDENPINVKRTERLSNGV